MKYEVNLQTELEEVNLETRQVILQVDPCRKKWNVYASPAAYRDVSAIFAFLFPGAHTGCL